MEYRQTIAIPGVLDSLYNGGVEREANTRINAAMRDLFDAGCRRFKFIRLPRTGDGVKIAVHAA